MNINSVIQNIHNYVRRHQTSNTKGDPSMSKKLTIGSGTLIVLSLIIIAIALLSPAALASRMSGKTPFTAKFIEGQISDSLAPGEVGWYQFTDPRPNGATRRVNMSLVFTPNKNNQERFIEFGIHDNVQLERWYLGSTDQLENLGQTFVVARDDDPNTGELINQSELLAHETYYIRVANNSDFTIYYSIFIDVEDMPLDMIRPQELMPKPQPAPAAEQAAAPPAEPTQPDDGLPAGIDPNHPQDLTLKPLEVRLEEGKIEAGTDHWFALEVAEVNGKSRYPVNLTLFVTPGDGNMIHKVHMDLFPYTYAHHWSVGNPEAAHNFGAGRIVERDGDHLTGERVWNGNLENDITYLVRLRNDNPFDIDFHLFTGDIINWEFGEPSPPPVPVRVAPGTDPNHALNLTTGVNQGDLAPGDEHWYTTKIVDFDGEVNEQLQLTMYMTPNGGNNVHKVNFHVYNMGDVHIWNRGDVESLPHFGSGAIVTRDHDEQTGTRFWDGWLIDGNEYLIRIRNSSEEDIHYWLFTDDIWNVNLANPEESFPRRW